jgi:hypothetical protein
MNKSKIIVMGITFIVLILITPLVFSKLMNAKFNQMLKKYENEGYSIKLIKDKSSYIQTDKVFEVLIPGKKVNLNVNDINITLEVKFKNLPVTNVVFEGVVNSILLDKDKIDFNKKVKVFVMTPNFKEFIYKLKDINYQDNNGIWKIEGLRGSFNKKFDNLIVRIKKLYFKNKFNNTFEIRELELKSKKDEASEISKIKMNLVVKNNEFQYQVKGLEFNTKLFGQNESKIYLNSKFKTFIIPNIVEFNNFSGNLDINNLKIALNSFKESFKLSPIEQQKIFLETLQKGFNLVLSLSLKDIKSLQNAKNLKGFKLSLDANILPFDIQKVNVNKLDFIKANLQVIASKSFIELLRNIDPNFVIKFLMLAKEKNKEYELNLEFKKGKLLVNE